MNKEIGWVVQKNLSSDRYVYDAFKKIFEKHSIPHEFVNVIPFDKNLPDFNRDRINIFYGSTTTMMNAYSDLSLRPGLFFDEKTFRMDTYNDKYGELMLNNPATFTTFKELSERDDIKNEELLFIRPVEDSKAFAGQVLTFEKIKNWKGKLQGLSEELLNENTEIMISEPFKINKEWRNYIVEGKVVSSSLYMKNQNLNKNKIDTPAEVIEFCENACKIFTPHDIFAMDVAETGGEYFILECGCMNSVGFYQADQEKIVMAIMDYMNRHIWKYTSL